MDIKTTIETLNRTGYRESHSTNKLLEFTCGNRVLYLNLKSQRIHLIAEPGIADQLRKAFGTRLGDLADYFNSNLKEFPRRMNRGSKPERYGTSVKPADTTTLQEFLNWYRETPETVEPENLVEEHGRNSFSGKLDVLKPPATARDCEIVHRSRERDEPHANLKRSLPEIKPPLIDSYVAPIKALPSMSQYTQEQICTSQFRLYEDSQLQMFYAPFDSVNPEAKVAIVGITPGFQQMEIAFRSSRAALLNGSTGIEACARAKQDASFAGTMRSNLCSMLDDVGLHTALGISRSVELFGAQRAVLHSTSAIRYPVFVAGQNYTGHKPRLLKHPLLQHFVENALGRKRPVPTACTPG